jgi:hypothetical protein
VKLGSGNLPLVPLGESLVHRPTVHHRPSTAMTYTVCSFSLPFTERRVTSNMLCNSFAVCTDGQPFAAWTRLAAHDLTSPATPVFDEHSRAVKNPDH